LREAGGHPAHENSRGHQQSTHGLSFSFENATLFVQNVCFPRLFRAGGSFIINHSAVAHCMAPEWRWSRSFQNFNLAAIVNVLGDRGEIAMAQLEARAWTTTH
jgi:hypothetical protein